MMNDSFAHILDNMNPTYIAQSTVHGNGLFAAAPLPKDHCLGTLDGQYIGWDLFHAICNKPENAALRDAFFMEWNAITPELLLTRPFRTKYSFINHARTPNLVILQEPLRVVALRDIAQDEELFLDYRKESLHEEYLAGHGKTYL